MTATIFPLASIFVSIENVLGDCVIAVDDVQYFVIFVFIRGMPDRASTR